MRENTEKMSAAAGHVKAAIYALEEAGGRNARIMSALNTQLDRLNEKIDRLEREARRPGTEGPNWDYIGLPANFFD